MTTLVDVLPDRVGTKAMGGVITLCFGAYHSSDIIVHCSWGEEKARRRAARTYIPSGQLGDSVYSGQLE